MTRKMKEREWKPIVCNNNSNNDKGNNKDDRT